MFLRATEMNATEMNLGGFFNVNRTLFKSVRHYNALNKNKSRINLILAVSDDGYVSGGVTAIPNKYS